MQIPIAIVHASAALVPRLTAEESLLASTRVAVGSGAVSPDDSRAIMAEWTRLTARASQGVVRRPAAADLTALGIVVEEVARG